MPDSKRPAGPGKPTNERRDSAVEAEELQELPDEGTASPQATSHVAERRARQAERDSHTKSQNLTSRSGTSPNRRRG